MSIVLPARLALAAILALAAVTSPAQAPAPADKPAHGCQKPEMPNSLMSDTRRRVARREYDTYRDCIKKYVDAQLAEIKKIQENANRAIEEFNAMAKEWNAAMGTQE